MAVLRSTLLLLLFCYCGASHILKVVPGNINSAASYIVSSVDIQETVIHFGPGTQRELLLSVPIETPESAIIITLGINSSYPNRHDADPLFTVTDGVNTNTFHIVDVHNYDAAPPCYPVVRKRDETRVSVGTKVPSTFKFTLIPKEKFGYCETAQEGGYINVGTFSQELDLTRELFLLLIRQNAAEQYFIHYISIETI